jgi:uncharacterized protein (DUF488 family)
MVRKAAADQGRPPGYHRRMRDVATIGHSTRTLDAFIAILQAHGIATLVDVRRFPASRRHPHFSRESLSAALPEAGIAYRWIEALGGRRSTKGLSDANAAWRVDAFHAYADYLTTEAGSAALAVLEEIARASPSAFMCAEAQWTRCHRRLIADALVARGWRVRHLTSATRAEEHELPEFARLEAGRLSYPATWSA